MPTEVPCVEAGCGELAGIVEGPAASPCAAQLTTLYTAVNICGSPSGGSDLTRCTRSSKNRPPGGRRGRGTAIAATVELLQGSHASEGGRPSGTRSTHTLSAASCVPVDAAGPDPTPAANLFKLLLTAPEQFTQLRG